MYKLFVIRSNSSPSPQLLKLLSGYFLCFIPIAFWLEPTEHNVLLSWYFVGINPNKPPTNSLTQLANTQLIPTKNFLGINACGMLNIVLFFNRTAFYSNSPDHSFLSGSFILHFKPFLGHLIISNIKNKQKFLSFKREAMNHFKIHFSTLSERKIYF